jgi:hypothetical protein
MTSLTTDTSLTTGTCLTLSTGTCLTLTTGTSLTTGHVVDEMKGRRL